MVAIETPGGKRNLNINISAQQEILKAYISKQFNEDQLQANVCKCIISSIGVLMYAYMLCHSEIDMLIWSVCIFLIHV